jgi:hypothetical protein
MFRVYLKKVDAFKTRLVVGVLSFFVIMICFAIWLMANIVFSFSFGADVKSMDLTSLTDNEDGAIILLDGLEISIQRLFVLLDSLVLGLSCLIVGFYAYGFFKLWR